MKDPYNLEISVLKGPTEANSITIKKHKVFIMGS